MTPTTIPRWTLAALCTFVAALGTWAATVLPWRSWTTFAIVTTAFAAAHGTTALLAWFGRPARAAAWRVQSLVALVYLGYLTWNLVTAASTIAALYGGLGRGVAVSLGLVWCIAAFVTVPLSAWGIACTGGLPSRRRVVAGSSVAAFALAWGVVQARAEAPATAIGPEVADRAAIASALAAAIPTRRGEAPAERVSLMTTAAAHCNKPPGEIAASIVVTWVHAVDGDSAVEHDCLQGPTLAAAAERLRERLAGNAAPGPIAIDVILSTDPLGHVAPVVDGLLLRPGLDGVCQGGRCLMPWQLLALDAFAVSKPIPVVPELRFGFDPRQLRRAMALPTTPEIEGLVRIETASFVADATGQLHALHRLREDGPPLDAANLHAGKLAAERYILSAQGEDGRFEYRLDPFVGKVTYEGFSLARQAGTTLVVCELAEDRKRAREVATAALKMLVSTQRRHGEIAALFYPAGKSVKKIGLGDTALATIALLSCRDLVGDRFDEDIDRMTRFLLAMQRPDGGFHPRFDLTAGAPEPGPDPLYAVGQAVFALSLLEAVVGAPGAPNDRFAAHETVRAAVDIAMQYTATDYWSNFAEDFFFMEENWHCLAARASLGHHRHDGYERFCLDYVRYKARLILDEGDEVAPDLVGGYGFGNVLLPHNTGSAGFGEAMSAALSIASARGEAMPEHEAALRRALGFLLHHQWDETNTFATSGPHPVAGGFSENMGSPHIRIDYVQHAMAAMGHGGRVLGLLE
jgi:hypothetical protein